MGGVKRPRKNQCHSLKFPEWSQP